ncbi:MAG: hypothetical protein DRH93_03360 [Deltaproteobacteria bacterium]|nr:MAG: hypothetical protein DRH93_03360 [Deltaproteobacteria bacterium]
MSNQWKITKDLINKPLSRGSDSYCYGTELGTTSKVFEMGRPMPVKFRLYDDDENLYFEGVMEEEDFHPLDDIGTPGYGCTGIRTSVNNKPFRVL